mmetsp:Transcript_73292/g.184656  ORF Transcript_73292/g.184656 Transcript_73292/m.184656 type:complete len:471 (-) Transcript_73292:80-1492(-)|eukprot:CAMPEP_0115670722 /NCGR_PEP_ID=MMETSP0272-20121206/51685_1 /TAXON_ID=71861 /ORGANISM="Scrippsiella trochoidea, Strain CCMP3099" /LENGTH=470 /DNA_ID=CAMNT_0003109475 /DNA_START=12 /DNA_END=1421 /DNA_ORIENTATION=+
MSSFATGLVQKLQSGAAAVQSGAVAGQQAASAKFQTMHQRVKESGYAELGGRLHGYLKDSVDIGALQAAGYGLPAFGPRWDKAKKEGYKKLFDLGAATRAKVMFGLLCATKSVATADPDMCQCIRVRIEDLVDVLWNDLTIFVEKLEADQRAVTLGKAAGDVEELGQLGIPTCTLGLRWWRARILYTWLPYDRSIFGQLKWPSWWILTIISLIPLYGIRVAFFSLMLLLIVAGNPADEYQLVTYIIGFKGSQFISSGVIQAIIAAIKYYLCVHPGGTHTCDVDGPGATQDLASGLADFLGSCILTWIAFLWLPCSNRSAGLKDIVDKEASSGGEGEAAGTVMEEVPQRGCCGSGGYDSSRGGRLKGLLGWDIMSFLLSCSLSFGLMYVDSKVHAHGPVGIKQVLWDACRWEGQTAIFWGRIFYAFLSFPFVVFLIPGLNSVLTHTTPTGYNTNGLCVPFLLHPMPEEKNK